MKNELDSREIAPGVAISLSFENPFFFVSVSDPNEEEPHEIGLLRGEEARETFRKFGNFLFEFFTDPERTSAEVGDFLSDSGFFDEDDSAEPPEGFGEEESGPARPFGFDPAIPLPPPSRELPHVEEKRKRQAKFERFLKFLDSEEIGGNLSILQKDGIFSALSNS